MVRAIMKKEMADPVSLNIRKLQGAVLTEIAIEKLVCLFTKVKIRLF